MSRSSSSLGLDKAGLEATPPTNDVLGSMCDVTTRPPASAVRPVATRLRRLTEENVSPEVSIKHGQAFMDHLKQKFPDAKVAPLGPEML